MITASQISVSFSLSLFDCSYVISFFAIFDSKDGWIQKTFQYAVFIIIIIFVFVDQENILFSKHSIKERVQKTVICDEQSFSVKKSITRVQIQVVGVLSRKRDSFLSSYFRKKIKYHEIIYNALDILNNWNLCKTAVFISLLSIKLCVQGYK